MGGRKEGAISSLNAFSEPRPVKTLELVPFLAAAISTFSIQINSNLTFTAKKSSCPVQTSFAVFG